MASTEHQPPLTAASALSALARRFPSPLAAPDVAIEPCDHTPPVEGRYVSECCGSYAIGEVDDGNAAVKILPTGICGACKDHAVFAVESQHCGEIVELPR